MTGRIAALHEWSRLWRTLCRGEHVDPALFDALPSRITAPFAAQLARRRRQLGLYDAFTYQLFHFALRHGSAPHRVRYAAFRRDLGLPLTPELQEGLAVLLPRLNSRHRSQAGQLLAEAEGSSGGQDPLPVRWGGAAGRVTGTQLEAWREAFVAAMRAGNGRICVVGNGASLAGKSQGGVIDAHERVVRFNRFASSSVRREDVGSRSQIWVCAPGYRGPVPTEARWVVISGPDMRWRLRDWARFQAAADRGQQVVTVPLAVWRELVAVLDAPPSAGVLMLTWLSHVLDDWSRISIAGFGGAEGGRYHHALPRHRAASRHNWTGERELLAQWQAEGLQWLGTERSSAAGRD